MLDKKEKQLIVALLEAQKGSISFLRGFRKPTKEEQDENAFYNKLIGKINLIQLDRLNNIYMELNLLWNIKDEKMLGISWGFNCLWVGFWFLIVEIAFNK